jgi:hypothetical protein
MKKLALTLLTAALLGLPASPSLAAEEQVDCQEPIAVGDYDGAHMSYALAVDYSTCSWWDGSPIRLEATLARLDAEGEEVADVVTLCGAMAFGGRQPQRHLRGRCGAGAPLGRGRPLPGRDHLPLARRPPHCRLHRRLRLPRERLP